MIQIACGGEHSVALTEGGDVYTFGAGNKGQLGHGKTANEHFPCLLTDLKKTRRDVHQVACGNNCTLILAGYFNPPSLLQRCTEVIRSTGALMEQMEASNLPADLTEKIRRFPDLQIA